jgi:galactose mutarotase-like enzyme
MDSCLIVGKNTDRKSGTRRENLAGSKENVVIRAGECTITLLPALGGKISSLRVGAHELLQAPLNPYGPRTQTMAFADSDASGWDECLPSVADCTVETEAGPATIPDHGDLWRVSWQVLNSTDDSATLRANCFSLPLQLTRSAILSETASGWRLQLLYSLTNLGAYSVPWSWSAHPLFAVEAGDRILLPEEIHALRLEGSAKNRLGSNGDTVTWPRANSTAGTEVDLSTAQNADSEIGDKLFAGPFDPLKEGWCTLERGGIGLRLTVRFESSLTPYLGMWLCYGGWPDGPGAKQVCVALEPATAPVDSLGKTGPWSRWLEPGETFTWPMELHIDSIEHRTQPSADGN